MSSKKKTIAGVTRRHGIAAAPALTGRTKIVILAAVSLAVAAAIAIIAISVAQSTVNRAATAPEGGTAVVRANSHVLGEAADGKVTLVEFLDFECEACGALYPHVEQLREDYAGRITFVTRYFPLPGHQNSKPAAIAAEAAAAQGEFEQMYRMMFETQPQWGERQETQAAIFRGFAEEIGLDMTEFDAAVADPATLDRVLVDFNDGVALGIQSTPTFFLNGEMMTITSIDDFRAQIDAALAE
ncbi:hypothetical protein GCM10010988_38920 [Cnuibacter physcomitrellae]|uniref:Disulfide bond formation protein DsbA n=1 Tax=Cnuibacter physcomitrellae TaxID=1619308 RepID=A0A1X9LQV4_9MICO|nr:thioredoxin domain-containing protein [Cnuibacter physcomitrellae]ARJ07566.1 disulfide bond formation protein DsbA [Cnuibacter physcomitrellae]GGI42416.1 hypothetical protein GCM10010988_38920 [Cnuibacter physcomitrellae]